MDTATLVDEQVDEGKLFVSRLRSLGVPVTVAFWALTSEDALWFLYIASPVVDDEGLAAAYRRVYREIADSKVRWLARSDIKLIGRTNPIALDAIAFQSESLPTRFRGRQLGNMIVDEAYIYPAR